TARAFPVAQTQLNGAGIVNAKAAVDAVNGTPPPPPPPTGGALTNGVAKTGISGATGAYVKYTMVVPAGATGLKFVMSGGTGDADMYVKFGSQPTDSVYDCRPYANGNAETCTIATAQAGTYYINLKGYAAFTGVSLTGSYTAGSTGCTPSGTVLCSGTLVNLPTVATGGVSSTYSIVVPAGKTSLVVNIASGTGDADLYVKAGSAPTSTSYTCRPYTSSSTETCTISSPAAGTYYMNVRAYAGFSGETLKATIN
ncbi:MAG: PPC domain-containing protein, partial [Lysobacteraceae bacterium]